MPVSTRGPTIAKDVNRMAIYNKVKQLRNTSRVEIANVLKLSKNTAGAIVDELIDAGFIITKGMGDTYSAGRKPVMIQFNAKARLAIGAQVSPMGIQWVITDLYAEPVYTFSQVLPSTQVNDTIAAIKEGFQLIVEQFSIDRLIGFGLGIPGCINKSKDTVLNSVALGWEQVDLIQRLSREINAKIALENSVHLSALGELWSGVGKSIQNFIYCSLDGEIGCSFIFDGKLYRGESGWAGDVSSMMPGLADRIKQNNRLLERLFHDRASSNPTNLEKQVLEETGEMIGTLLGSIINLLNVSTIVLGGQLSWTADYVIPSALNAMRGLVLPQVMSEVRLIGSTLHHQAGCIGAAAGVIQNWEEEFDHNNFRLIQSGWGGSWYEMAQEYMFKPFQEKHPSVELINDVIGNSGDILAQIESQRTNPKIDLVTMTELMTVRAIKAGLLQKLSVSDVPELEEQYEFAKMEPYGPAILLASIGIAYNPKMIEGPIQSWFDLLDARYRGLIGLPNFTNTSAISFLIMMAKIQGGDERSIEQGFDLLQQLKANVAVQYKTDAQAQLLFERKEIGIAVWWNGPAYATKKKADVEFVLPNEGSPIIRSMINLVNGAPHPQAANKMIGYYISRQAQQGMVNDIFYGPVNKYVQIPESVQSYIPYGKGNDYSNIKVDWNYVADHVQEWKVRWDNLFQNQV